jgi:hypothetical protein
MKQNRISPKNIISLKPWEIFVFGSNLSGFHGAGAAKIAMGWGAKWGKAQGLCGNTYAIPTKSYFAKESLSLEHIKTNINFFLSEAKSYFEYNFMVTEIGCGLAGYTPKDIAPLFKGAIDIGNIFLPETFWNELLLL